MLDGEEAVLARGQDRLLLRPVGGADGEDRALRGLLVAVALQVRLAERAFLGERLARDVPGAAAAVLLHTLGHLRQPGGDSGHVIVGLHRSTVRRIQLGSWFI